MATEALAIDGLHIAPPSVVADVIELRSPRVEFAGTLIDRVDREAAIARIRRMVDSGRSHQIVTVNLDFLSIAARTPRFQATINDADLAVPDGMPLVWLSRLKGEPLRERVTGVDLVDECCRIAAEMRQGIFLLGAAPGIANKAADALKARHPDLDVVGTYAPPMGELSSAENAHMIHTIRAASPGFLFVALGAPRQDLWIREHLAELGVPVSMGVGCVLDLLAGAVSRAPVWMQEMGLEWAYRLVREPGRLWRRYLLTDAPMLGRLVLSSTRDPATDRMAVPS